MKMLDDHVVLLTGAGSGLGLGVARYCLQDGAKVAIMEIVPEKVQSLQAEFGKNALVVQGDVTSIADLKRCREAVVKEFGRLDALMGLQGIFDQNLPLKDIALEKVGALFDELFHTNVLGYILSVKIFVDLLEASNGAIVLTSSTAAYAADGGGTMYTATKGAIRSLIGQLAFEFGPKVRVSGVAPSVLAKSQLRGPATLGLEHQNQSQIPVEAFLAAVRRLAPLQHLPQPEEYGPIYAFLASHHNRIMTGQSVVADQGVLNRAVITAGEFGDRK
jgi:NAD(P)-dependent dehydrogenase (short-subunit alcohol dehydrogenase family)